MLVYICHFGHGMQGYYGGQVKIQQTDLSLWDFALEYMKKVLYEGLSEEQIAEREETWPTERFLERGNFMDDPEHPSIACNEGEEDTYYFVQAHTGDLP